MIRMKSDSGIPQGNRLVSCLVIFSLLLIIFSGPGCSRGGASQEVKPDYGDNSHLFTLLSPEATGVDFSNVAKKWQKRVYRAASALKGAGCI